MFDQDVPRPDGRLRPLPRPQVRRDLARRTTTPCSASSKSQQLPPGAVRRPGRRTAPVAAELDELERAAAEHGRGIAAGAGRDAWRPGRRWHWPGREVVVDYAGLPARRSGCPTTPASAPARARAGDLGRANGDRPARARRPAAVYDRVWDWSDAGRRRPSWITACSASGSGPGGTIRTPAFTIAAARCHYLVRGRRGSAVSPASDDPHRSCSPGRCTGQLIKDFPATPGVGWVDAPT